MLRYLIIAIILNFSHAVSSQSGYSISVVADGYEQEEIYLGFYLGQSQFVHDTTSMVDGIYRFEGEEALDPGFYIIVFPPDNQYLQLLIGENDTDIHVKVDPGSLSKPEEISGSEDTRLFYEYAKFISKRRAIVDTLRVEMAELPEESKRKTAIQQELEEVNDEVLVMQDRMIDEHANTLTAMLINANREIEIPKFDGPEEDKQEKIFSFYKYHYFDNIPLSDPRIVRTPFLHDKLTYYLEKLTYQNPDSLIKSIDFILGQFQPESEAFKVYLVNFLNTYAKSKIVGMDAVYVHLVTKYYAEGLAPWTEEDQLAKIIKNANTLKPILIGEIAPNLTLLQRNKDPISIHDIKSDYTVLFFWDPDCGHCKKSIPALIDFYNEYHDRGVEILSICTKLNKESDKCWEVVDERGMDIWINAYDPYLRSRFKQIYDVRVTPQVFVLDSEKKIVMKKIGTEQLSGVLDHMLDEKSD